MKDLTLEDLQKIKHWVRKNNKTGTCPMCGSRCIIDADADNFYKELLKEDEYEDNITSPIIKKFRRAYLNKKYKEIDRAVVNALLEPERKERKNENTIHNNKRCVSSPD